MLSNILFVAVGPKCTLVASHASPDESRWIYRRHRLTDGRTPDRYMTLSARCAMHDKTGRSQLAWWTSWLILDIWTKMQLNCEYLRASVMYCHKKELSCWWNVQKYKEMSLHTKELYFTDETQTSVFPAVFPTHFKFKFIFKFMHVHSHHIPVSTWCEGSQPVFLIWKSQ